jgi:hypothetical protein
MTPTEFDYVMKRSPSFRRAVLKTYHPLCIEAKLQGCGTACRNWRLDRTSAVEQAIQRLHGALPAAYREVLDREAGRAGLEAWQAKR